MGQESTQHIPETHSGESIAEIAERLNDPNLEILLKNIQVDIHKHAHYTPGSRNATDILESRFTPAQQAYDKGLTSCGNMATISAEKLN